MSITLHVLFSLFQSTMSGLLCNIFEVVEISMSHHISLSSSNVTLGGVMNRVLVVVVSPF